MPLKILQQRPTGTISSAHGELNAPVWLRARPSTCDPGRDRVYRTTVGDCTNSEEGRTNAGWVNRHHLAERIAALQAAGTVGRIPGPVGRAEGLLAVSPWERALAGLAGVTVWTRDSCSDPQ